MKSWKWFRVWLLFAGLLNPSIMNQSSTARGLIFLCCCRSWSCVFVGKWWYRTKDRFWKWLNRIRQINRFNGLKWTSLGLYRCISSKYRWGNASSFGYFKADIPSDTISYFIFFNFAYLFITFVFFLLLNQKNRK